jgi:uncharacterized protein
MRGISIKLYVAMEATAVEKRYRAFGDFLKEIFGCKVYKVSVDAGFTCPNRDGTLGVGGCIYCTNLGFSPNTRCVPRPMGRQLEEGIVFLKKKYKAEKFIAYFQAYTNTYGPFEKLERLYREALAHPDIVGLSVGTRPDCIEDNVVGLLAEIAKEKHVWIELGLQSAHDETLERINRKHSVRTFVDTVHRIKEYADINVCAHVILGLPGETREMMLDSATLISDLGVNGVKIHLLHVLKETPLEEIYKRGELKVFTLDEYAAMVSDYIELLATEIVIQRLTADGPSDILIAPRWALEKKRTIDKIEKELLKRDSWQGKNRVTD